jgi:glycosyltransferase involved in cell wall biosynthesis
VTSAIPLVSVIVPTFNGATYLPFAIESVRRQTYPTIEIIVVDDGSTDGTGEMVARMSGLAYVCQLHQGIGAARNAGVALAQGELLAFLDADDLFAAEKIARQVDRLLEDDHPDIVFGRVVEFVSDDVAEAAGRSLRARPGAQTAYLPGAMLVRREAFPIVGQFDTTWRVGEFVDWYLRATEAGLRTAVVQDVVLRRRLHGSNVGIRRRGSRSDYAHIFKHALDRRRRAARTPPTP